MIISCAVSSTPVLTFCDIVFNKSITSASTIDSVFNPNSFATLLTQRVIKPWVGLLKLLKFSANIPVTSLKASSFLTSLSYRLIKFSSS